MPATILIRGAGDLASGVALRLRRVGLNVAMTELAQPLAVRRTVSFAEAVYEGSTTVEGVTARRIKDPLDPLSILDCLAAGQIAVLVDPQGEAVQLLRPLAIVDARMTKLPPEPLKHEALLYVGLGPGFAAPGNCHAVIETQRGHAMGRVIWSGSAAQDSMQPDGDPRRVLRAPRDGIFESDARIGQHAYVGEIIASVAGSPIRAPFAGIVRGLLRPGVYARKNMKIGDIDARDDPKLCMIVSDKSLAVGGGVLEAMLTRTEVRTRLWA